MDRTAVNEASRWTAAAALFPPDQGEDFFRQLVAARRWVATHHHLSHADAGEPEPEPEP